MSCHEVSEVSIPVGFSSSLRRQSIPQIMRRLRLGFNPCRVFKLVATMLTSQAHRISRGLVSIPVGFSSSLRLSEAARLLSIQDSFNPCRVFKLVATGLELRCGYVGYLVSIPVGFSSSLRYLRVLMTIRYPDLFQSLSGFLARCDTSVRLRYD